MKIDRTDNAIKNYWNGALKRKEDSYSPNGHEKDVLPDICIDELRPDLVGVKADRQNIDRLASFNQRTGLVIGDNICSTELTLGRSYGSEGKPVKAQKCRSSKRGTSGVITCDSCEQIADHTGKHSPFAKSPLVFMDSSTSNQPNCTPLRSPLCYSTPPNRLQSVYASSTSPKSRLKSLARTFKNTPSIIRKRASRSADHANFSGASCSTALNILSLDEAGFNSTDSNSSDYVRGLSCLRHKPETSDAYKSLGRCLEREFDAENDPGIANCEYVYRC